MYHFLSHLLPLGDGHFSPIAAYHEKSDKCLVLDVARFKYAPYWVNVADLFQATKSIDQITGRSRGWFLMYPPLTNKKGSTYHYKGAKTVDEGKRPVGVVPLAGDGKPVCPIEGIRNKYCFSNDDNKSN